MSKKQLADLKKQAQALLPQLQRFVDAFDQLENATDRSVLATDEHSDFIALYGISNSLDGIPAVIKNLFAPIAERGVISKNQYGRYELNGHEFTCGSPVEVLCKYDDDSCYYISTRIEHNGSDYYAKRLGHGVSLQGVEARIKRL